MAKKQKRNYKEEKKMKRVSVLMFLVLSMVLTISSSVLANADFFGIQILAEPEQNDEAFSRVWWTDETHVSYKCQRDLVNSDIHCFVYSNYFGYIVFDLNNGSKRPVELNSIADKYELLTKDDTLYKLDFTAQDYSGTLNPGESKRIWAKNPLKSYEMSKIKILGVTTNYGKIFILLRRIEDEE